MDIVITTTASDNDHDRDPHPQRYNNIHTHIQIYDRCKSSFGMFLSDCFRLNMPNRHCYRFNEATISIEKSMIHHIAITVIINASQQRYGMFSLCESVWKTYQTDAVRIQQKRTIS